jgi:hypothetical protein
VRACGAGPATPAILDSRGRAASTIQVHPRETIYVACTDATLRGPLSSYISCSTKGSYELQYRSRMELSFVKDSTVNLVRALPDPDIPFRDANDFIFDSALCRRALHRHDPPAFPVFLRELIAGIHRLTASCHLPEFTDHGLYRDAFAATRGFAQRQSCGRNETRTGCSNMGSPDAYRENGGRHTKSFFGNIPRVVA